MIEKIRGKIYFGATVLLLLGCNPILEKDGTEYIMHLTNKYHCYEVSVNNGDVTNIYYKTEPIHFLIIRFRSCDGIVSYDECNTDSLKYFAKLIYSKSKNRETYSQVRVTCSTDSEDRKVQEIVFNVKNGELIFKEKNVRTIQ
jgi:hypothetical protein